MWWPPGAPAARLRIHDSVGLNLFSPGLVVKAMSTKLEKPIRREIDIDGDPLLHDLSDDQVPVIFINGREAFRYFVHPEEFVEFVRDNG